MGHREQAYADIFVTAIEGGIGYWSTCSEYRWRKPGTEEQDLAGFRAVVLEMDDDDAQDMTIDLRVIKKGVRRFVQEYEGAVNMPYFHRAATCLRLGKWDDLDVDADIADAIVQFGLFSKVVYG